MNRTWRGVSALVPVFVLGTLASAAFGLKKTAVRVGDLDGPGDWDAAAFCQIAYYNLCTGWVWVWGGWDRNDMFGVCYDTCCPAGTGLENTSARVYTAAPAGRGFTGSIDIWTSDGNGCPSLPLASQLFLPSSGWNSFEWGGVAIPASFVVTVTVAGHGLPSRFASDHPAVGPTGPQACGMCFQLYRLTNSYDYGARDAVLCPGQRLNDGVCDVEWLWDAVLSCGSSVNVGGWFVVPGSWAAVKALYR